MGEKAENQAIIRSFCCENSPLSAGAGVPPRPSAERSTRRRARWDTGPSRTGPAFSCCVVCASEHDVYSVFSHSL